MMAFFKINRLHPALIVFASYLFLQLGSTDGQRYLRKLYNSRVVKAERYERPLASFVSNRIARILGFKHSGVVVTLENGERWLVHKGSEYSKVSDTVVVNAKWMSSNWTRTSIKHVYHSRVVDYVRAGGATYNLFSDNCHDASRRMMRLN